jgi:hypothetical protein
LNLRAGGVCKREAFDLAAFDAGKNEGESALDVRLVFLAGAAQRENGDGGIGDVVTLVSRRSPTRT